MIYQLTIPISNYENNGIFFQELFFENDKAPTFEDALVAINFYHERDSQFPEYYGEWKEVMNILIRNELKFPRLGSTMVEHSTQIVHPKYGQVPMSLKKLNPYKIGETN